jgi:hypothetical protein
MTRGTERERGAVLVVVTILMTTFLGVAALVIDLGQVRNRTVIDQSVADFAALAAGPALAAGNPLTACQAAVKYINTNAHFSSTINGTSFCTQVGKDVTKTTCSGGSLSQAAPSVTVGAYTVSLHYPVPASEISDPNVSGGARLQDGIPCERLRVIISAVDSRLFSKLFGSGSLGTTRSATVRPSPTASKQTPALWLLDPVGCVALNVSGGSQLTVGVSTPTSTIAGVVTVDSDGSTCNNNQNTISVSGSGTFLHAIPNPAVTVAGEPIAGEVDLLALPSGQTTCSAPACDPADVSSGRLSPQPVAEGSRATRSAVDWKYNCKAGYPTYHTVVINDCQTQSTQQPYIDNLKAAIGASGAIAGFSRWSTTYSCNPSGTVVVPAGNWWVDCPSGLSIGNGTNLTFTGGNVVMDGGLTMTGGSLTINTSSNPNASLPPTCIPPQPTTLPCTTSSSQKASFVYIRNGDININGGTPTFNHVSVVQNGGVVKITGGAPPTWLGSTEGPFDNLGLWSETSSNKYQINGGAGVQLSGVFFTPEAVPFSLSGNGDWGQQNAQFISYRFSVTGGGKLTMAPNSNDFVQPPSDAGLLIR